MSDIDEYKEKILEIDQFVRRLDEGVRAEAFRLLMARMSQPRTSDLGKGRTVTQQDSTDEEQKILSRLANDTALPIERLPEVFAIKDSAVQVVDSSIPNDGPADLVKQITLLCAYGNLIGRAIAKVDLPIIYRNLRDLNAATTAYARDVKKTAGVKVLADGVMLIPEGRQKAKDLLAKILGSL